MPTSPPSRTGEAPNCGTRSDMGVEHLIVYSDLLGGDVASIQSHPPLPASRGGCGSEELTLTILYSYKFHVLVQK